MNHLILLSGGTGSRMKSDIPKQYIPIGGKPIFIYTLDCFDFSIFQTVVIVVAENWKEFVVENCKKSYNEEKIIYAPAGKTRQESIFNGLRVLKERAKYEDIVVIHDAARACCSQEIVKRVVSACESNDGAMPVLPIKDTVYLSENGYEISRLLNRDKLFAGQAPEAFKYGKYLTINESLTTAEFAKIKGSSEIAFKNGMKISLVEGDEANFKITTPEDLERFKEIQLRGEYK